MRPSLPAPAADDFRRRFHWALWLLFRGKWIILGCVLLLVGPMVGYLYVAEREFTATAEILIEAPDIGDNLLERSYGKSRLNESAIQTEADILSSAALAAKVIAKLNLDQDPEFNASLRTPKPWQEFIGYINPLPFLTGQKAGEQTLSEAGKSRLTQTRLQNAFLSKLSVKSRRRSFVISVSFTADNGEKAALIANTLADLYIIDRLEVSLEDTRRANDWLAQRLDGLRQDVAAAEKAVESFRSEHGLAQLRKGERELTIVDQQLIELNSRLVIARSELAQKQARYDQLRSLVQSRGSVETAYDVLQSTLIQRLREQEAIKQRELSEAMKTYGDRHPRIIGARADLQELRGKISQEISKIAAALATETEASRIGVQTLERQIEQLRQTTNEAGGHEVTLRELERQAETSRGLYEAFLSRFKRDAEQERIQRANARVLSEANIPVQPSAPRRLRLFMASFLLSLFGGIGLVFLIDRLNGRVRSAAEAEHLTGLPILAAIPHVKTAVTRNPHSVLEAPRSPLANAFRSLRAVLSASGAQNDRITLVTSSVSAEGKSFVTRNLALSVAATGKKVLLIDADLMRPTQHLAFGLSPEAGLTQILIGTAPSVGTVIVRDEKSGLDLLPAGPIDAETGNALVTGHFDELVRQLASHYDHVFVDAPPTLAATDAQLLSRIADQIVFVIRWNHTPRDAVLTALSYLQKVGVRVAGITLSQTKARNAYGSYGTYGYYGGYGNYGGYSKQD